MLRTARFAALTLTVPLLGVLLPEDEPADPLAGARLDDHIAGPRLEEGALVGKVVLFEYFGYY